MTSTGNIDGKTQAIIKKIASERPNCGFVETLMSDVQFECIRGQSQGVLRLMMRNQKTNIEESQR